jgi:hypothetical protein
MPFLDDIVKLINTGLKANALSDARFAAGQLFGIATPVVREKLSGGQRETLPCIYDADEPQYIGIDDSYPIMIYHRLLRNTTRPAPAAQQFGDGQKFVQGNATLAMIVYADRLKIKMSPDALEALIAVGTQDEIPKTSYPSKGFSSMLVIPVETNFNTPAVFAQEYPNASFFLKPESILFQITYNVASQYRKDCLGICGC